MTTETDMTRDGHGRSIAHVPTANGDRYTRQLCKHWSHKLEVTQEDGIGRIRFPDGSVVQLEPGAEVLTVRLEVPAGGDAERMRGVIANHLDRFAFREAPLGFDWSELG